jgi:hypothetical protein
MDDWNYYGDPRVTNAGRNKPPTLWDEDAETEIELPTKWEVCGTCDGKGKHVNPSIDAGGLTGEDFGDDPEFHDSYMRGAFDVTCSQCAGRTTVPVVDWDRLTPEQTKAYESQQQDDASYEAERLAERRMGA